MIRNGDTVDYAVRVSNSAPGACDVSDASFTLLGPSHDGTAGGQPLSWVLRRPSWRVRRSPPTPRARRRSCRPWGQDGLRQRHGNVRRARRRPSLVRQHAPQRGRGRDAAALTLAVTATPNSGIVPLKVDYDFLLTNASSTVVPMSDPSVSSAGCSPLVRGGGDTNANDLLDNGEGWHYSCASSTPSLGRRTRTPSRPRRARSTGSGQRRRHGGLRDPERAAAATSDADQDRRSPTGFVPFTATYTYDVVNDSDANARPVTNVSITDTGCAPAAPASADIPRGETGVHVREAADGSGHLLQLGDRDRHRHLRRSAGLQRAVRRGPDRRRARLCPPPTLVAEEETRRRAEADAVQARGLQLHRALRPPVQRPRRADAQGGPHGVARKTVKPDRNCRYRVRFDVLRSRLRGASTVTVSSKLGKRSASRRLPTPA